MVIVFVFAERRAFSAASWLEVCVVLLQICQSVLLLCHRGPRQRAHHSGDHPQIRGAAGQILRQRMCVLFRLCGFVRSRCVRIEQRCFGFCSVGLRVRYYFQLWESLLHPGRVLAGRRGSGNLQKECAESHRAGGPVTGGKMANGFLFPSGFSA